MSDTIKNIPLFDPKLELEMIGYDKLHQAMDRVLHSGFYMSSTEVAKFEERIADMMGVKYVVAVSSGTTALELCLRTLDLPKAVEVKLNANTFVAVAEAIINTGYTPQLLEMNEADWQFPANEGGAQIVSHLYGNMSKAIDNLSPLLIEDTSQSFGAKWKGKYLGTFADLAAVSLYPTKNLAAVGDAGMVLTNNEAYYEKLKALRNHGQTGHQQHTYCGTTARMDELQAAVLNLKLDQFADFAKQRQQISDLYHDRLSGMPLALPKLDKDLEPAPNLIVARSEHRDAIRAHLSEKGIATGVHYPVPIHKMPAYSDANWAKVDLPETELLLQQSFTLPLWVGMGQVEVKYVCDALENFFGRL